MSFEAFLKRKMDPRKAAEAMETADGGQGGFRNKWSDLYKVKGDPTTKAAEVVLRFLPPKEEDGEPYAIRYSHFFKGDLGKWVVMDICPTTHGQSCPVCDANSRLWNMGGEAEKEISRKRKRRKAFLFNVVVINDPLQPQYNGTVQTMEVGYTIFQKIISAMKPEYDSEQPKNPFNIFGGNNFIFRMKVDKTKGQITYEDSKFEDKQTDLFDGDEGKLKEVFDNMPDLKFYLEPEKTQEDKDWGKIVASAYSKCLPDLAVGVEVAEDSRPAAKKPVNPEDTKLPWDDIEPKEKVDVTPKPEDVPATDEEDDLAFFAKLAKEV